MSNEGRVRSVPWGGFVVLTIFVGLVVLALTLPTGPRPCQKGEHQVGTIQTYNQGPSRVCAP